MSLRIAFLLMADLLSYLLFAICYLLFTLIVALKEVGAVKLTGAAWMETGGPIRKTVVYVNR